MTNPQRVAREGNVVGIDARRRRSDFATCASPGTPSIGSGGPLPDPDVAAPTVRDTRDRQRRRAYLDFAERSAALASPARVRLAVLLCQSPAGGECGRSLAMAVGLSETTVSHHLRLLRHVGLIESHRRGISVHHVPTTELVSLCSSLTGAESFDGSVSG